MSSPNAGEITNLACRDNRGRLLKNGQVWRSNSENNAAQSFTFTWSWDGPMENSIFKYKTAPGGTTTTFVGDELAPSITASWWILQTPYFEVWAEWESGVDVPWWSPTPHAIFTFSTDWMEPGNATGLQCTSPPGVVDGAVGVHMVNDPQATVLGWTPPTIFTDNLGGFTLPVDYNVVVKKLKPSVTAAANTRFGFAMREALCGDYLAVPWINSGVSVVSIYLRTNDVWSSPVSLGAIGIINCLVMRRIPGDGNREYLIAATSTGLWAARRSGPGNVWSAFVNTWGVAFTNCDVFEDYLVGYTASTLIFLKRSGPNTWGSATSVPAGGAAYDIDALSLGHVYCAYQRRYTWSVWESGHAVTHNASKTFVSRRTNEANAWRTPAEDEIVHFDETVFSGLSIATPEVDQSWLAVATDSGVYLYHRTTALDTWVSFQTIGIGELKRVFLSSDALKMYVGTYVTSYVLTRSSLSATFGVQSAVSLTDRAGNEWGFLHTVDKAFDPTFQTLARSVPFETSGVTGDGAVYVSMRAMQYKYRNAWNGAYSSNGIAATKTLLYPSGSAYFGVSATTGYNASSHEASLEWSYLPEESSSSSSSSSRGVSSGSSLSSASSSITSGKSSSSSITSGKSSSSSSSRGVTSSTSSTSYGLTSSSSKSSRGLTSSSSKSSRGLTSSSSFSEPSSVSSSSSSSSSSSTVSSQSSQSSAYGWLEAPTNFAVASSNPIARQITLTWDWANPPLRTPSAPTGFVIERKIGTGSFTLVTYAVDPAARTYVDTLSATDAARVFAYGETVYYRLKAYWIENELSSSSSTASSASSPGP